MRKALALRVLTAQYNGAEQPTCRALGVCRCSRWRSSGGGDGLWYSVPGSASVSLPRLHARHMFDPQVFIAKLNDADALRSGDKVNCRTVDRVQPSIANAWPDGLHASLHNALDTVGIPRPYLHQAEAVTRSVGGCDVVMESPTASGKTLGFAVPMLDALIRDRRSHALMIYPMKALAFDQREQLRQLCKPLHSIESWPYDGDTPQEHRDALRQKPPRILLTNPEYLNMSFLAWRDKWEPFLRNLRFVVIDEMHEYRGFFGGNVALLLRRFFLHLARIGSQPRIFLSTATCANPKEHARNLTGRDDLHIVSARNILRPRRHYIFVDPDIPDFRYRDILQLRVEQASLVVLRDGLQALVFCPTKRFLESAFRKTRDKVKDEGLDPDRVSAFHADLKNDQRQDIQQKIKAGEINIVFTTNALELGLDIGGLDGVILAGFPASTMSAWQQIGRAGRGWNKDAFVLFYAMNDPIDRFFVGNLDAFLNRPFDELVVDPSNQQIIENHLPSLANETGGKVEPAEEGLLGPALYRAAMKMGQPIPGFKPQSAINLRGGFGKSFKLKRGNEEIGQISAIRRFREAYIGAVFTFFGHRYRVHSHEESAIVLADAEPHVRTEGGFFNVVNIKQMFAGYGYGPVQAFHGSLNIIMNYTGYKLIDEQTGEQKGTGGAPAAHFENNLHAFLLNVPQIHATESGAVGALEHLLRVGAMFVIPADRFDTSTFSKPRDDPAAIFYYENYTGGIGVAKKLSEVWPRALEKGIEVAGECPCEKGCPNCIEPAKSYDISNASIDKTKGIELGKHILAIVAQGPDKVVKNGQLVPLD